MSFFFRSFILSVLFFYQACAQQPANPVLLGGPCEGCEAIFEFEGTLGPKVTIANGKKGEPLLISGTIFEKDGETPADGVILYVYHTDANGIYPTTGTETNWARRHGNLRAWIKTAADGTYEFRTIRPASYPNTSIQQHIHATILEPDGSYYYIQDFLFDDDPNLNTRERNRSNPRGGSGHVLQLKHESGTWLGYRDIVLRAGL